MITSTETLIFPLFWSIICTFVHYHLAQQPTRKTIIINRQFSIVNYLCQFTSDSQFNWVTVWYMNKRAYQIIYSCLVLRLMAKYGENNILFLTPNRKVARINVSESIESRHFWV